MNQKACNIAFKLKTKEDTPEYIERDDIRIYLL